MLLNIILVVFLSLMVQSLNAVGTVEIELGRPEDQCGKYTKEGHNYLALTHIRVIETPLEKKDGNSEIVNNIVCNVVEPRDDKFKYKFRCDGKRSGRTDTGKLILISVKVIKQMLSGSIEYMYSEEMMKLFENGFLDPANMKNEKFHHNRHLHIKSVTTNGVINENEKNSFYPISCHGVFPHSLIADHGLFMMRAKGLQNFLTPMYYEPIEQQGVLDLTLTNHGL